MLKQETHCCLISFLQNSSTQYLRLHPHHKSLLPLLWRKISEQCFSVWGLFGVSKFFLYLTTLFSLYGFYTTVLLWIHGWWASIDSQLYDSINEALQKISLLYTVYFNSRSPRECVRIVGEGSILGSYKSLRIRVVVRDFYENRGVTTVDNILQN